MVIDTLSGSGKIISEKAKRISQLLSVDSLLRSDRMFVSRHDTHKVAQYDILREELSNDVCDFIVCLEDGYDESKEETYRFLINETKRVLDYIRYHYSETVQYGDVRDQILSGVSSDLSLGSMAYEESWDYSKYGHTHDFTQVRLSAAYSSPSCLLSCQLSDSTGQIASVGFCIPPFAQPTQYIYEIGEMKLLATNGRTVDVGGSDFDGWVFADGSVYGKSDFPSAYEAFKSSDGATATSFKVPLISGFIRPYPSYGANLQKVAYQNHVSPHTHEDIDNEQLLSYSNEITAQVVLPVMCGSGSGLSPTAMHTGYISCYSTMKDISVEIESEGFVSNPTETSPLSAAPEPLPKRNLFSVMVYIGKKGE